MYFREIQTIKNVIQDEMPYAVKMLPGDKLDELMMRYQDQMSDEISTAVVKDWERLNSLDYLERVQETEAIARMTREIVQDRFLQEIRAKYQPITE